jgi:CubicO group peptidase (beta-lactamase class C family)
MLRFLLICLSLGSPTLTQITAPCPYLGEIYPPPKNFISHPLWVDATRNLTQALLAEPLQRNATSFAIQVISQDSKTPIYIYENYHKAPGHLYGVNGEKNVDGDTIFRIGSISKLFTIYALLLQCGFRCFEDPITKYVPELQGAAFNNNVDDVKWEEVTVGALAAQLSGIGRDCRLELQLTLAPLVLSLCSRFLEHCIKLGKLKLLGILAVLHNRTCA